MVKKLPLTLLLVPLLIVVSSLNLGAQQLLPNGWMPNGTVNAIARNGDIMYVAGEFTQVGRTLAHGVVIDPVSGLPRENDEKLIGTVSHAVSDGQGGYFLNGVSGLNYKSIVHLLPNGQISTVFNPVLPGNVSQLKVLAATADRVLVRTRHGNPSIHSLYCLGYDGSILWSRNANGRILEGIVTNGSIIVVGNFTTFEGQSRIRAAALNILTGELLPWNTGTLLPPISDPLGSTANKRVALGISNNELFIRWRSQSNTNPNSMVASVNLQTGIPTGWALPAHLNGTGVPPMLVHNGKVYLGTNSGQGLLILDAATKQTLSNPTGIVVSSPDQSANRIRTIAAINNTVYLGDGELIDENGLELPDVVAFNETTLERENFSAHLFQYYVSPGAFTTNSPSTINCMLGDANGLFIGGSFPSIMVEPRTNIYAFNVVTGELLPFAPEFLAGQAVTQLHVTESRLYASGFFEEVNGQQRLAGLASFNLADGSLNDWNPDLGVEGNWGSVYGYGDRVYIYGGFTNVNGNPRNGVAAFDVTTGNLLNWSPSGLQHAVAMTSNELGVFVAGRVTGNTENGIFFFNHETGTQLFPALTYNGGNNGADAVHTMATNETSLYVGGDFTVINSGTEQFNRPNFAAIDLEVGQVNDFTIETTSSFPWGYSGVTAIAATNGSVYLGGYFANINGVPRHTVAAISSASGELTDWKFKSIRLFTPTDHSIKTIVAYDDGVFIGGEFDRIDDHFYINNLMRVSPDRSNVVTGRVYYDINQNGIQDAGEAGVPNLLMELQPGNMFYPTDANGNYTVFTGIGNYTVRPVHPTYAISVLPNQRQLSFTDDLQVSESNDFAVAIFPSITDVGVSVTTDQAPRPGFYFNYILTYTNHGTIPASGSVQFTFDPRLLFQSGSINPAAVVGNQLTYNFTQVEPGQSLAITLNLRVPVPTVSGSMLGEHIVAQAFVTTTANDQNPADNQATLEQTVIGSVDPNDKLVTPQGFGSNGYIAVDTDHMEYTIRFQNVGTAPATFVTLEDVLDPNLNISTFTVVSASHAYTYQIVDRTLSVLFDNINLIDSLTDEPNSHGYFTFTIGLNDNLPVGTQIQNTASIIFDYNLPLETNTVTNTLRNPPYETTIFLPDSTGTRNSEILMPVFVNDWSDVLGAQFSVAWDNTVATFVGVESFGLPGMDVNSFNLSSVDEGHFSFAWSDPAITAQSLPDTTALFYIRFNLSGDYGSTTPVAITHFPVAIEVISTDYVAIDVTRIDGVVNISADITIQGTVQYANDEGVQNVTVQLTGDTQLATATDTGGNFAFTFAPAENEERYELVPVKQNDPDLLNGIDVQDVASIRRHILRTELFTSAYQVIAADVSNNSIVSIQDVILLQALILGVETDFPSGRQWTFIDEAHEFTNVLSPFPYPQNIALELSTLAVGENFDFTAVKIGDVTLDRDNTQVGRTKGQEVMLEISSPEKKEDGTYEVSIATLGFVDVSAYQFTIGWDATKLEFLNVVNEGTQGIYGEHKTSEGLLSTLWDDSEGASLSLDDNTDLFRLRFKAINENDPGVIEISDQLTAKRMFDDQLNRIDFNVRQQTQESKASGHFYPNPFQERVNISFTLKEAQSVSIEILNDLGQKITEIENFYEKGWNEVSIDGTNFKKGLYLFSININGRREVSKLVKK